MTATLRTAQHALAFLVMKKAHRTEVLEYCPVLVVGRIDEEVLSYFETFHAFVSGCKDIQGAINSYWSTLFGIQLSSIAKAGAAYRCSAPHVATLGPQETFSRLLELSISKLDQYTDTGIIGHKHKIKIKSKSK